MAHILLIEPDAILAGSLEGYFGNAKHTVSAHNDPQSAITQADKQLPDVVIIELQLAGRSGIEFLYEFRSYPDWQDIPVIVYTSLHQEATQDFSEVFQELNIYSCLYKPAHGLMRLLDTVEASLRSVVA